MSQPPFEEVTHTADWALRATGVDLPELMVNAAKGMLSLMQPVPGEGPRKCTTVNLSAPDPAALLVRWLEELLFRMETRGVTFTDLRVELPGPTTLRADVEEARLDSIAHGIKAVTYHGLQIEGGPGGYQATVVFDV